MSSLKKMKKEIDFLNEHHLHDILHEFYDDEKYYLTRDYRLEIQDHNSVEFPRPNEFNATFKSNMICKLVLDDPCYFEIYQLIFNSPHVESKLYKKIITNTTYGVHFEFQTLDNLLYFSYIKGEKINIEIVDTAHEGRSWKIEFDNYGGRINQILFSGNKIILDCSQYIYIISRDGSYNMIKNERYMVKVNHGKLYLYTYSNIITVNLDSLKSKLTHVPEEDLLDFHVTKSSTILICRNRIDIYGPKKFTIKNSTPPDDVLEILNERYEYKHNIEYNIQDVLINKSQLNKNETKLSVLICYDEECNYGCLIIIDLELGIVERRIELDDYTSSREEIGFLNTGENQFSFLNENEDTNTDQENIEMQIGTSIMIKSEFKGILVL
jgi:hypothetical protein